MKKLIVYLNIISTVIICACVTCGLIFDLSSLVITSSVLLTLLCLINLIYKIKLKSRSTYIVTSLSVELIISTIAMIFIQSNFALSATLFVLAQLVTLFALILNSKFEMVDLLYAGVVALPTILTLVFAPIFGFGKVYVEVLMLLYMIVVSAMLGKCISTFVKRQNKQNTLLLVAGSILFAFNILMMLIKFSNVSYKFEYVFYALFYIVQLFFIWSIFSIKDREENLEQTKTIFNKRDIKYSLSILFSSFLISYAFVSSFFCFNIASAKVFKEDFYAAVRGDLNIPVVEISTQNKELPKNKEDYVNCSFSLSNCEDERYNFSVEMASNFDDDNDGANSVGIRLRGNSTKDENKRPYRIKFEEKQSIMGLTKNKSWVLLADYYDQSYIRNYAAYTIADAFDNLDFSPTPYHVALIMNGEFKGLYLLCEQMDENKGRTNVKEDFDVNVDTEFPFLVEMDEFAYKEGITGVDNFYVNYAYSTEIKYPESDDRQVTEQQDVVYDYIYEYINAVFKTLNTGEKVQVSFRSELVGLEDLVDIDSAVDYYLVNEIMLNTDSTQKSIYMHKTKDGKLKFGPIWDFDFSMCTSFELPYSKSYIEETSKLYIAQKSVIFKNLIKNEEFYNKVIARYSTLRDSVASVIDSLKEYKSKIDNVALIDCQMWHGYTGEFQYDMQYDYVRLFLLDRCEYLDEAFSKTHLDFLNLINAL